MPAIDWANLRFGYSDTDYNVRCRFENGKWGEIEVSTSPTIELHMAASSLHYGQEVFEGLKAFRGRDGKIRVFRLEVSSNPPRGSSWNRSPKSCSSK
jgi:branched-chain amino acid aminotransferase